MCYRQSPFLPSPGDLGAHYPGVLWVPGLDTHYLECFVEGLGSFACAPLSEVKTNGVACNKGGLNFRLRNLDFFTALAQGDLGYGIPFLDWWISVFRSLMSVRSLMLDWGSPR